MRVIHANNVFYGTYSPYWNTVQVYSLHWKKRGDYIETKKTDICFFLFHDDIYFLEPHPPAAAPCDFAVFSICSLDSRILDCPCCMDECFIFFEV